MTRMMIPTTAMLAALLLAGCSQDFSSIPTPTGAWEPANPTTVTVNEGSPVFPLGVPTSLDPSVGVAR